MKYTQIKAHVRSMALSTYIHKTPPKTILKYTIFENLPDDILNIIYENHKKNKIDFSYKYFSKWFPKSCIYKPMKELIYYNNRYCRGIETHNDCVIMKPSVLSDECSQFVTPFQVARSEQRDNYKSLLRQLKDPLNFYHITNLNKGGVSENDFLLRLLFFKHTHYVKNNEIVNHSEWLCPK